MAESSLKIRSNGPEKINIFDGKSDTDKFSKTETSYLNRFIRHDEHCKTVTFAVILLILPVYCKSTFWRTNPVNIGIPTRLK